MAMQRTIGALALALGLALSGCSNDCRKACERIFSLCNGAPDWTMDVEGCVSDCEENLSGCKNLGEQQACVLDEAKTSCGALESCPGCLQ